jgi:hypothetical protein
MAEVTDIYEQLVKKGWSKKDAAKQAQAKTGISVVTGKPIRSKQLKFTSEGVTYGQQDTLQRGFGKTKFGQQYN